MRKEIFKKKRGKIMDFVIYSKKKAILLGIMSLLIISCKNPTGPTQVTIEIQGHVSDAVDNSPICGASVELKKITGWTTSTTLASTLTDNDGFYHLKYEYKNINDCKESLLHLLVGYNLQHLLTYRPKNIWASDTPHVRCAEELQTIDVKLEHLR